MNIFKKIALVLPKKTMIITELETGEVLAKNGMWNRLPNDGQLCKITYGKEPKMPKQVEYIPELSEEQIKEAEKEEGGWGKLTKRLSKSEDDI